MAQAAHQAGKWTGICGELGGDPDATSILVGLGVDELSLNPARIPRIQSILRELTMDSARALAEQALPDQCGGAAIGAFVYIKEYRFCLRFAETQPKLKVGLRQRLTCKYLLAYNWLMDMDAVFKALADPTRRSLLDRLYARNGQTLSELCADLEMTRQAVTQHLALLEGANLVVTVWHGREKLHYLNPAPLQEIHKRWLDKYERHRLEALSDLKRALESNISRIKE